VRTRAAIHTKDEADPPIEMFVEPNQGFNGVRHGLFMSCPTSGFDSGAKPNPSLECKERLRRMRKGIYKVLMFHLLNLYKRASIIWGVSKL
jgi:hypothetical protein